MCNFRLKKFAPVCLLMFVLLNTLTSASCEMPTYAFPSLTYKAGHSNRLSYHKDRNFFK